MTVSGEPALVWYDISSFIGLAEKDYLLACANFFRFQFIGGQELWEATKKLWDKIVKKDPAAVMEFSRLCIAARGSIYAGTMDTASKHASLHFAQPLAEALQKSQPTANEDQELFRAIICLFEIAKRTEAVSSLSAPLFVEMFKNIPPILPWGGTDSALVFDCLFGNPAIALPSQPGSVILKKEIPETAIRETLKSLLGQPAAKKDGSKA